VSPGLILPLLTVLSGQASAQATSIVGTRAQGMGGAFVGVADDASAVYWNPAGLAGGAYFSLVVDGGPAKLVPDGEDGAATRSSWLLALTTPAVGLSYYRLHSAVAAPAPAGAEEPFRLDSLVTHNVGATLVQSLFGGFAVGTTLRLVRGAAGSADVPAGSAEEALDNWDVVGEGSNTFDFDAGLMASGTLGRVGLLVRNITEPSFTTGRGEDLRLERQVRAGASVVLLPDWILAADVDFLRQRAAFGDLRELAIGTESRVTRRLAARAGLRLNTAGERGRTPAYSVGGSFAVLGSLLVDAQVTAGSDEAFRGWGVAGRVVF
jgi:hypothetical protein